MAEFTEEQIAPCGMNCGLCSWYLADRDGVAKEPGKGRCGGCAAGPKRCSRVWRRCKKVWKGEVRFCSECGEMPCAAIQSLDKRYRTRYGYSFVENLKLIREKGIGHFLEQQGKEHSCPECGGALCVHNGKCYGCEKVGGRKG